MHFIQNVKQKVNGPQCNDPRDRHYTDGRYGWRPDVPVVTSVTSADLEPATSMDSALHWWITFPQCNLMVRRRSRAVQAKCMGSMD